MAMRWCRKYLGINKRRHYQPTWSIRRSEFNDYTNGEYDAEDNAIFIYWDQCETVHDLIDTAIHEWTHQLQPVLTHYNKYKDYMTNPYEVEARNNERIYGPICWAAIKHKVNK